MKKGKTITKWTILLLAELTILLEHKNEKQLNKIISELLKKYIYKTS